MIIIFMLHLKKNHLDYIKYEINVRINVNMHTKNCAIIFFNFVKTKILPLRM